MQCDQLRDFTSGNDKQACRQKGGMREEETDMPETVREEKIQQWRETLAEKSKCKTKIQNTLRELHDIQAERGKEINKQRK